MANQLNNLFKTIGKDIGLFVRKEKRTYRKFKKAERKTEKDLRKAYKKAKPTIEWVAKNNQKRLDYIFGE